MKIPCSRGGEGRKTGDASPSWRLLYLDLLGSGCPPWAVLLVDFQGSSMNVQHTRLETDFAILASGNAPCTRDELANMSENNDRC